MNLSTKFLTLCLILIATSGFSQKITEEQKEKEKNKVKIFTSEENDNLQRFYYEEVNKMKLSEEKREEYYNTLLFYTHSMSRLDDKDKNYTEKEMTEKFNELHDAMNTKMKALLTPEQYVIHLETFGKIMYSVNQKKKLKNTEK
ncbi:hypothetical protein [Flavivirga rizhaonensis]|uniref:Uncharacterized protein n=1 Tax=Flavivirga rizhaonensis TaxID=2559571 RepID=A0A4S1DZR6_9FLAO|nr:hypothetical protein [Flavivirga rizhaonensis]TGV03525.1 hypothetical protein EM932_05705 [Flavivirga rizhaonensis]